MRKICSLRDIEGCLSDKVRIGEGRCVERRMSIDLIHSIPLLC